MDPFEQLAEGLGVPGFYTHAGGHPVAVSRETRTILLQALGFATGSAADIDKGLHRLQTEEWRRPLPPVAVFREGKRDVALPLVVPAGHDSDRLKVAVIAEDGDSRATEVRIADLGIEAAATLDGRRLERRRLPIGPLPAAGYHQIAVTGLGEDDAQMPLIVVPASGHLPEAWQDGGTGGAGWGWSVDLYGRRSAANGGLGTFTDLGALAEIAARLGVSVLALNPLHALFLDQPERCSPYSPNSRLFLNALYIDPAEVPEFDTCEEACQIIGSAEHQALVAAARKAPLIDYAAVAAHRMPLLEALYGQFRGRHLATGSERDRAFHDFCRDGGQRLEDFARFEVLGERLRTPDCAAWSAWPAAYRDPRSSAVAAFAAEHRKRVDFHLFLQWEATRQRRQAAGRAKSLPLGFCGDVAVGFDRDGFDAWAFQDLVPAGVSAGCPPDLRNPMGQDWGVCPFDPRKLRAAAYGPYIELLRATMRDAGMLRIDHAFQLARLFWVPLGHTAREGGYVRYPVDDLMGILALESQRQRCVVLAEDLGTFPEGFPERMAAAEALSFRVLHREREGDRRYRPPAAYPRLAAVTAGTHDQATVAGFWIGRDIAVRTALNLYPTPAAAEEAKALRVVDRERLIEALQQFGGLGDDAAIEDADGRPTQAVVLAVHRFLAHTPARLVLVQLGDVMGHEDQINLPGTTVEYPNWRQRGRIAIEDMESDPWMTALAEMFRAAGRAAGEPPIEQGRDGDAHQ